MMGWSAFTKDDKQTAANPNKDKKVTNKDEDESVIVARRIKKEQPIEAEENLREVEKEGDQNSGPPIKVRGAGVPIVKGSAPQYAMPLKLVAEKEKEKI